MSILDQIAALPFRPHKTREYSIEPGGSVWTPECSYLSLRGFLEEVLIAENHGIWFCAVKGGAKDVHETLKETIRMQLTGTPLIIAASFEGEVATIVRVKFFRPDLRFSFTAVPRHFPRKETLS